jgi:predicted AlkP superfamily pyrophosphatase or phosphodiesterase
MRALATCLSLLFFFFGCVDSAEDSFPGALSRGFQWPAPDPGARPKVLLVGWDGVRPDVLAEVPTPNFDALVATGTFSDQAVTASPTASGPCWSSILIGVWPEKHGVVSNDFSPNRYQEYPDFLTRLESVNPDLNTFAAADWLPLVSDDAGGPLIGDGVDKKTVLNGYLTGWLNGDSLAVEAALGELRVGDPDALFVYLGAPDEISHGTRSIGERYRASIASSDRHLGRLVMAIQGRATISREDWLVMVITDHGRTAMGAHGGDSPEETRIFYLASGPSARVGPPEGHPSVVDVAVTALTHLGVAIDPAWKLDGKAVGLAPKTP